MNDPNTTDIIHSVENDSSIIDSYQGDSTELTMDVDEPSGKKQKVEVLIEDRSISRQDESMPTTTDQPTSTDTVVDDAPTLHPPVVSIPVPTSLSSAVSSSSALLPKVTK